MRLFYPQVVEQKSSHKRLAATNDVQVQQFSSPSQVQVRMALHQVKSSQVQVRSLKKLAKSSQVQVHFLKKLVKSKSISKKIKSSQVHHILE